MFLFQQIWTCVLCKKKQEILVKTGQWYHGSMAKPVTLDMDMGSDASSIKTDSSSVSDKRYSESGPGIARTLPPDTGGGAMYGPAGAGASPMGVGPAGYDPTRSTLPPGSNSAAAVTMSGGEFGARPTPNGALGQMTSVVDSSGAGRNMVDQNGRMLAETGVPRQAIDASGRPLYDATGKPLLDQTARPMLDSSGRSMLVDSSGRPIVETPVAGGRGTLPDHRAGGLDATGRPVVDHYQSTRPQPVPAATESSAGRPLLDSTGRPLLDFAGNPIMDYSGRQLPTDSRPTTDSSSRPVYPADSSLARPPPLQAVDQRPMVDQTGRPAVMDHPGSVAGMRPVTDAAGRPLLPDSAVSARQPTDQAGRPLSERGTNDLGYSTSTDRPGASQPKLDPAGRPMFDASGRMIMEPVPLHVVDQTQSHQALPVDAKVIVDPHLGPIGDIHSRGPVPPLDSSAGTQQPRFDVHGRPLPADVQAGPDALRRSVQPLGGAAGMEAAASLSAGLMTSSESRGRMLPDIESRAPVGAPSVQDWRGGAPVTAQEVPLGQRGVVEAEPPGATVAWQGKASDPAITSAQQRAPPPQRHVPGEPWRQQPPGPHRYADNCYWPEMAQFLYALTCGILA